MTSWSAMEHRKNQQLYKVKYVSALFFLSSHCPSSRRNQWWRVLIKCSTSCLSLSLSCQPFVCLPCLCTRTPCLMVPISLVAQDSYLKEESSKGCMCCLFKARTLKCYRHIEEQKERGWRSDPYVSARIECM